VGALERQELSEFYLKAKLVVVPSLCLETFCLVAAEAMSYGLPVIASGIGSLAELVENGINGFLFEPGNGIDLAKKIRTLWNSPELCQQMGEAGRKKALLEYTEDIYYKRLIKVYQRAIDSDMPGRKGN
jgi:glycosyltransferase involved in cell wall biosynthesis